MISNFLNGDNLTIKKIHTVSLIVILLQYIIPLIIFGQITLFYLDALDSEIVYNTVIGKILNGNFEAIKLFLNGEIKVEYLRRVFQPYMIAYAIFDVEFAYWSISVFVKLTSYFSFFILAKKINQNKIICGLISVLFASCNVPYHEGFGLAILPYISYLILYKDALKIKHYLLIIFFGLNSDLIFSGIGILIMFLFFFLFLKKEKYIHFIKILIFFSLCILLSNLNLIFISFYSDTFHRVEFIKETKSIYSTIISIILNTFKVPTNINFNFSLLLQLPLFFFVFPLMVKFLFSNKREVKIPIYVIILTICLVNFLNIEIIANYINQKENLLRTISWAYLERPSIFLYCLASIYLLKDMGFYNKIFTLFICLSIFLSQINPSLVPFVKDKIKKVENYQNLYTFSGYYNYYDYNSIKEKINNDRTISIGLDPMVAVFHNIKVIDGYHSIYPLQYKKKFRKIIEKELEKDPIYKKYYDNYGSRVYSTLYSPKDPFNIELNFKEAKKLGASFVISKYQINSKYLKLVHGNCIKDNFCLYRIN